NAYADLPGGDRAAHLERAIACYEAALRVRTETAFPQDWAMTQHNLGLAFVQLGNLVEARRAFDAAVRGYRAVGLHESAAGVEAEIAQLPSALPED
ncbi:MAG: tetratricopeptide repeat protein, partial [Armatimonadetes bacterium]|nr:tetratricopeptide repeat protein [Armatimonadota bacterium]